MSNDAYIRQIVREELSRNQQQARFNLNVNPNVRHTGIDAFPIDSQNLAPGLKTSGRVEFDSVGTYTFNTNFKPSFITFYGNPYHTTGGTIASISVGAVGGGYSVGDLLNINGGVNGTAKVTGVGTGGSLSTVSLQNAGYGYSVTTETTTSVTGVGTGGTISINSLTGATTIDRHTFVFGQAALGQNLYMQPLNNRAVTTGGILQTVQTSTMFLALNSGTTTSFQAISSQTHLINVEDTGSVVARASVSGYGASSFTINVETLASQWVILGNYFVS